MKKWLVASGQWPVKEARSYKPFAWQHTFFSFTGRIFEAALEPPSVAGAAFF